MAHAAPVAVVTGATGFVASELVKQLLEKGYTVRGTVRSLHNESKVQHLERLGKTLPGQLTLHEADLIKVCLSLCNQRAFPACWRQSECSTEACYVCRRDPSMLLWKEPQSFSTQRESTLSCSVYC